MVSKGTLCYFSRGNSCFPFHEKVYEKTQFKGCAQQGFCRYNAPVPHKREFNDGTWITDEMEEAYSKLHKEGYAVSVEVYEDEMPAGGLYGVSIGRCFFGESMYSDKENGSKTALIAFAQLLEQQEFLFIDCQFHTEHLEQMGGRYISWETYDKMLQEGLRDL